MKGNTTLVNHLENISESLKNKDNAYQYSLAKKELLDRRDYLFPLITELAKKNIRLKDVCEDLYYEYLEVCCLIETHK